MARITPAGNTSEHPLDRPPVSAETPLGTEFVIKNHPNGLYYIKMIKAGGKVPEICDEAFTSMPQARRALEGYIASKQG